MYVSRTKQWDEKQQAFETYEWALACTKRYASEKAAVEQYAMRTAVEDRNKQLTIYSHLAAFTSPADGLMETHLTFILLTYSLLQLYLRRNNLPELTHSAIDTLRQQERLGRDAVIVYAGDCLAVLNLDDYSLILIEMDDESKAKLETIMTKQREVRRTRESSPRFTI